jgi:hypothetical protein
MLASALMMAATLVGGDLHDPDGVVATAPETPVALDATYAPTTPTLDGAVQQIAPHGLSTDQQIDRWLESRDPDNTPYADTAMAYGEPRDDREMHGEFSTTIGTGGYRDYGAAVSLPLGENGRLNLSYRQTENGYPGYGYGYGSGYGLGHNYWNDSGYVFPGRSEPGAAWEYEMRVARPGGPPMARPVIQPNQRVTATE